MTAIIPSIGPATGPRLFPWVADRERPALAAAMAITAVIAAALSCGTVGYSGDLDDVLLFLALIWACSLVAGAYGMGRVEDALKSLSVILFSEIVTPLASAALARVSLPLADPFLAGADRLILGFDLWPGLTAHYPAWRGPLAVLAYAYVSLGWMPFLLAGLLSAMGRRDECWRFVTAWTLSLLLCTAVFPWCPAVGAYAHFGITAADTPEILVRSAWHYPVTLQNFRTGLSQRLDLAALDGIVAMPSFHACASVLLGWSARTVPLLRVPFAALSALMWVSSVPIGGHYAVDVIAGSLVAVLAIRVSGGLCRPTPGGGDPRG